MAPDTQPNKSACHSTARTRKKTSNIQCVCPISSSAPMPVAAEIALLTCDPQRYRSYFPRITPITPGDA